MSYQSMEEAQLRCKKDGIPFWKAVQIEDANERGVTLENSWKQMTGMWQSMLENLDAYEENLVSQSGMVGKDGGQMDAYRENEKPLCGDFMAKVMANALKMGCNNACMKRIVAAPTAGSCGVIPAVLLSYEKCFGVTEDECVKALLIAAGIGAVIAENASIAGAAGGCQAEIGSASAMAAAGLAYMQGADSEGCANALALALKSMLGLTCDPVCGLVEVPCIKRNVSGAVNAITAAQMTMAGIKSVIPADEVIDSMRRIGNDMPVCLKETGEGGLAITPTAKVYKQKLKNIDN